MPVAINLTILLMVALGTGYGQDAAERAPGEVDPIQRIAIIGASASAGFGVVVEQAEDDTDQYSKTMLNMKDLLVVADGSAEVVYLDLSSHLFFSRPRAFARSAVDRLLQWKPELVFGVDFLFWFTFGALPEEKRLDLLEVGLGMLDEIAETGVPVVIGEVPDLEGTKSFVISTRQIPKRTTVIKANRRINEWASERANVAVVPLQRLTDQLSQGAGITVGSHQWNPQEEGISMVAVDKLHPTFDGMICLVQAMEVAARSIKPPVGQLPPLELDRDALMKRMRLRRLAPRRRKSTAKPRTHLFFLGFLDRMFRRRFLSLSVVASSRAANTAGRTA